jgi:ribosome maturation factor RimP
MGLGPIFRFCGLVSAEADVLSRLRDELSELLTPVVSEQGLELWELEYHVRAGGGLLRLYVDSPNGVTVDDCERVSRGVSALLDESDPIPGQYTLEVSSPGLDRVLRKREHFLRFVGEAVRVETTEAIGGRKRFSGRLTEVGTDDVTIELEGRAVSIPLASLHKARLVPTI